MIGVTSFLGNFAREIDVQPVIDIDPPENALRLTAASAHSPQSTPDPHQSNLNLLLRTFIHLNSL